MKRLPFNSSCRIEHKHVACKLITHLSFIYHTPLATIKRCHNLIVRNVLNENLARMIVFANRCIFLDGFFKCVGICNPAVKDGKWRGVNSLFRLFHHFGISCSPISATLPEPDPRVKRLSVFRPFVPRPNIFYAVAINQPEIVEKITEIQKGIVDVHAHLKKLIISPKTLHITLAVCYAHGQEQLEIAKNVLSNLTKHNRQPFHITFNGVGCFRHDVLFVKSNQCEPLIAIATDLRDLLEEESLISDKELSRSFEPHLTIAKVSKQPRLRKPFKRALSHIHDEFKNDYFGEQNVESILLCSMVKKKQDNGFYHVYCEEQLKINESLT